MVAATVGEVIPEGARAFDRRVPDVHAEVPGVQLGLHELLETTLDADLQELDGFLERGRDRALHNAVIGFTELGLLGGLCVLDRVVLRL